MQKVKIPSGYEGVVRAYTLPPADSKERVKWEQDNLEYVSFPWGSVALSWGGSATRFQVNKRIAYVYRELLEYLHKTGYCALIKTFGGAYFYRAIRGSREGRLSTHAFGCAHDFNVKGNELGSIPNQPYLLVKAHLEFGFVWGGLWSRPDGMHWQLADY